MSLSSLQFLVALLLLSAVFFYIPGLRGRQALLAACSAGFLYLLVPNAESWIVLAVFVLSGFGTALVLKRWPSGWVLGAYVLALVFAFVVIRKYDFVMAWVSLPDLKVHRSGQRYEHLAPGRVRFSDDDGFTADLELDENGLILVYPGLARRAGG